MEKFYDEILYSNLLERNSKSYIGYKFKNLRGDKDLEKYREKEKIKLNQFFG